MIKSIILGGGCFWGLQELFRSQPGVVSTVVGYCGGTEPNPTYKDHAGHAEVVKITYDTETTSLEEILDFFFRVHDPTTLNRQGNDVGSSYRSVIFYESEQEREVASQSIKRAANSGRWDSPIVTTLEPIKNFAEAEAYHQDYLQKNPEGYTCHYVRE